MKQSGLRRVGVVVAICALVGALAGIAGSAAAPSKSSKATQAQKKAAKARAQALARAQKRAARRGFRLGGPGPGGPWGGPVHAEAVVPNADGTGFETVTTDAGILKSVDGKTIHIKEGTDKATYKDDVAIDAGDNPTVIRNHEKAALSDLKEGDHVRVIKGPKGTFIMAEDDAWLAQEEKERERFGFGHRFRGGPGGPPPGAPGYPGDQGGSGSGGSQNGSDSAGSESGTTNS